MYSTNRIGYRRRAYIFIRLINIGSAFFPRADKSTNPIIQTRNLTVKKDREAFDQQRHTHELKQLIGNARSVGGTATTQQQHSPHRNAAVKKEMKHEQQDESASDLAAGVGEYDDDGYSYTTTSGHSTPLPVSPEPGLTANSIKNPSVLLDQPLLNVRQVSFWSEAIIQSRIYSPNIPNRPPPYRA